MRIVKLMGAAGVMAAFATIATAAEPAPTLVVHGSRLVADSQRAVPYGDLQLASAQGRDALRERVALAIADLCDPSRFSVAEPHDALKCRNETWAQVAPRLEQLSPRLASR